MAQENKLPFMHRLMYSIYPNQMSLLSFQVVGKKKKTVQKHIKKAEYNLQYSSVSRTDALPLKSKCVHNFT